MILGAGEGHRRQVPVAGQPDLLREHCPLHVPRRKVVVIVEAHFADGSHEGLGLNPGPCQFGGSDWPPRERRRTMRVDAGRRAQALPKAEDATRPADFLGIRGVHDAENAGERGGAGAPHHGFDVRGERPVGQVRVRIDHA